MSDCEKLQEALLAGEVLSQQLQAHLEACPACQRVQQAQVKLFDAFQALESLPAGLEERIMAKIQKSPSVAKSRIGYFKVAVSFAAAVLALGLVFSGELKPQLVDPSQLAQAGPESVVQRGEIPPTYHPADPQLDETSDGDAETEPQPNLPPQPESSQPAKLHGAINTSEMAMAPENPVFGAEGTEEDPYYDPVSELVGF